MDSLLKYGAMLAMAAVAFVLFLGLRNMMRGGDGHYSNKMMQLRIFLQFIALVLIFATIYFSRHAG
ncbi:twin transmembrane helix small protein [Paenochrobactrum sp. BZR 588]|uniref:twin transmembrane helix small protein n=1 Tax=Paenochrobactrum TaxID=999488 RepID=UPI0035BC9453